MVSDQIKSMMRTYKGNVHRRAVYMSVLLIALLSVVIYSLTVCRLDVSFVQAVEIIINNLFGTVPERTEDYVG